MERALLSKREGPRRSLAATRRVDQATEERASAEDRVRFLLKCVVSARYNGEPPLDELIGLASSLQQPLELSGDEPGQTLAELLACSLRPSVLLRLFACLGPQTQRCVVDHWRRLAAAVPLCEALAVEDRAAAAQVYVWIRAAELARVLESDFAEDGNSACSHGDLFLTRGERYYLNYTYLFRDFDFARADLCARLRELATACAPSEEQLERVGGEQVFRAVVSALVSFDGEDAPRAFAELHALDGIPTEELVEHLNKTLIGRLTMTAVARRTGFLLSPDDLLEVYELLALLANGHDIAEAGCYMLTVYDFETGAEGSLQPTLAWQNRWREALDRLGPERPVAYARALLPVYEKFACMLGMSSHLRPAVAWIAASLDDEACAHWVVDASTRQGCSSPIIAASILDPSLNAAAFARLAQAWLQRVEQVPEQSTWSRDFTTLVVRYVLSRQRTWLLEPLLELYMRGGGYEAGESRDLLRKHLVDLLDEAQLGPAEQELLLSTGLRFDLLPIKSNVFTGERIDDSPWASPTSAKKYVSNVLKLADRPFDALSSLIPEKRALSLEKSLRQLDFHASVQQITTCYRAFEEHPEQALELLLLLKTSQGERPENEWLERCRRCLAPLGEVPACDLLWALFRADAGDVHSLNPGLFWALRLVPHPTSVAQLAKAATEMVRREPSFAVAALDTLDAIASRSALSAILQMRRRIRNRKVLKLINRTIDRIARQEGLDSEVFLDYAVDSGDLERDGSRAFEFGTHHVSLSLEPDGHIEVGVVDSRGKRLRSFPKTAKDANPDLYAEFQFTKKQLVDTLAHQSKRLEASMIARRSWRGRHFVEIFGEHPVLAYLGRRLIWCVGDPGSGRSCRPTLEGIVDVDGQTCSIDPDDLLFIAHPLHLDPELKRAWLGHLAANGIEQPFDQLNRRIFDGSDEIGALSGRRTASADLYRIVKERGWLTDGGGPWEVGNHTHSYREFRLQPATELAQAPNAGTPELIAHLDTFPLGYDERLTIRGLRFTSKAGALEPADVDRVFYSETLRDIMLCLEPSL